MRRRSNIIAALLVALACATTASSAASPGRDAKIAAQVPAQLRTKGTLLVATAATYPPNEFISPDSGTFDGMDMDLIRALTAVMGLRPKIVNVSFDTIMRGLASRRYDVGISSITDTKARENAVDFVTYFSAGTAFYVKTNTRIVVRSLDDLCGRTVAVVRGTTQSADAAAQNAVCRKTGKRDVSVAEFPDHNGAYIAVTSSDEAVGMADSPVAAYLVSESRGALELTGKPYGRAPYGIALPKGNGMAKPVRAALRKLMADGTYRAILRKWGIQSGMITNPQINGATSENGARYE